MKKPKAWVLGVGAEVGQGARSWLDTLAACAGGSAERCTRVPRNQHPRNRRRNGCLRANFGTDGKPLHVGFAAAAAVRAALLAQAGAQASDDVWGEKGFYLAFDGGLAAPALLWSPDTPWAIEAPGFEHKRFPSCYMTHRLIAGVLQIRERLPAAARGQPVNIDIEFPKDGLAPLKYPIPANGRAMAKHSTPRRFRSRSAAQTGAIRCGSIGRRALSPIPCRANNCSPRWLACRRSGCSSPARCLIRNRRGRIAATAGRYLDGRHPGGIDCRRRSIVQTGPDRLARQARTKHQAKVSAINKPNHLFISSKLFLVAMPAAPEAGCAAAYSKTFICRLPGSD